MFNENYGDVNFFEYGRLMDTEHSDTEFPVLFCMPYDDEENKYQFAKLLVDITESWIDKKAVCDFAGEDYDYPEKDAVGYAVACLDYYGAENFGALDSYEYCWFDMTKEDIMDILKYEMIDPNIVEFE